MKPIGTLVPDDWAESLDRISETTRIAKSQIVRDAILEYLKRHGDKRRRALSRPTRVGRPSKGV